MPENVWPLINIDNYIFFKKRLKNKLGPCKRLENLIFNPSTPRPRDDNPE